MELDRKKIKVIQAEKKKQKKYISRSQKAMAKNIKKIKKLEREMELLLTPCLPGLEEVQDEK